MRRNNFLRSFFGLTAIVLLVDRSVAQQYSVTDLGDLPGGASHSRAVAINNSGQVVGTSTTSSGPRAFIWSSTNGIQDLGTLAGLSTRALGINDNNQVVGESGRQAVMWTIGGGIQGLGDLPGGLENSTAYDINNSSQIVGRGTTKTGFYAFLRSSAGDMQDLGTLPSWMGDSRAFGINNSGQVVGYSGIGTSRAFLWTAGSGMQDLGDLPGGSFDSSGLDINNSGQVVGSSGATAGGHAFLWTAGGGMQDLNSLIDNSGTGWNLQSADAINDAGQIVGFGINPDGFEHAFLLTPIPEPGSYVLLVSVVFLILLLCLKKITVTS